jgi:hypothetical protein
MNLDSIRSSFDQKVRAGIFNPIRRHLASDIAEDRLQEGIGLTWAMYLRAAEQGKELDDALLVHSCRLRAADLGRFVAPADGHRKQDVFDLRNQREEKVALVPLKAAEHANIGFAERGNINPVMKILSAINLGKWLSGLEEQDRQMLELRAAGFTLEETGEKMGLSTSAVFSRCKRLGVELAEHAELQAA